MRYGAKYMDGELKASDEIHLRLLIPHPSLTHASRISNYTPKLHPQLHPLADSTGIDRL